MEQLTQGFIQGLDITALGEAIGGITQFILEVSYMMLLLGVFAGLWILGFHMVDRHNSKTGSMDTDSLGDNGHFHYFYR